MPFFSQINNDELRVLNAQERQVIALVAWVGFFTCFNFIIYFFFNDAIINAFFPKDLDSGLKNFGFLALVVIGYISRPLGGLILADIADRFGRKTVMLYALVTITFSTLIIGLMPTYDMIGLWAIVLFVLMRLLQGIGVGSEVPISWVYMLEQVPRWQTGLASGLMIAMLVASALFVSISSVFLSGVLTLEQMQNFGWRVPFILGSVGSLVTIFLSYRLTETPLWLVAKNNDELLPKLPVLKVLKKYRYGLMITFVLSWFSASIYLIVFLLLPSLAVAYFDASTSEIMIANGLAILFASLGAVMFGYLSDRFNSGKVFGIGCMLLAITNVSFFYHLAQMGDFILLYYVIFGFFVGVIGIVPSICVGLFLTKVRATGTALAYNLAYAGAGVLTPILLTFMVTKLSLAPALYVVFLCIGGVIVSILLANLHGLYRLEKK